MLRAEGGFPSRSTTICSIINRFFCSGRIISHPRRIDLPAESRKSSFERTPTRVTIIAEVGSVHDGSLGNARKLVELAAEAGADVAKFQTHIASAETLRNAPSPPYFQGEARYEYF